MKRMLPFCLITPLCVLSGAGCSSNSTGSPDAGTQTDLSVQNDLGGVSDLAGGADLASNVIPTEVMVSRVGDGTATLAANTAAAVYLERHKIADGSMVGSAVAMPTAISGAQRPFSLAGTATSEGALTRSVDGRYVLLAGYDSVPGNTTVMDNSKRVIGRVAADGAVDTSTSFDGLSGAGNNIRSAASTDGTALWVSGVLGIAYTTLGSTAQPTRLLGDPYNVRVLGIANGQLYVSRASDTAGGINTIGTGLPTSANVTAAQLPGFPNNNNMLSSFGFVAFDRDATPGIDTLYVADDRIPGGGVQRWSLSNNTWMMDGTVSIGVSSAARGLAGYRSGASIMLVATTAEAIGTQTRLVSLTDSGGAIGTITVTTLATAAARTAYRGVCLAPTQ